MKRVLMVAVAMLLVCSCRVKNRVYDPVTPQTGFTPPPTPPASIVAVEPTPIPGRAASHCGPAAAPGASGACPVRTDKVDPNCDPLDHACVAFLEYDDFGEVWDPGQLNKALDLIQKAKHYEKPPIVVTFVHGWKNNADDRDLRQNQNITGFEGVLEYVKSQYAGQPVVGIYIAWRGELISPYWPVRRQLSYFNRESTAIRIPGPSMTAALTQIMEQTHRAPNHPEAVLIMVGHSFGGLILERALSQATVDFILRTAGNRSAGDGAWADLVVFVNSAAAATEGKQMINFLMDHSVQWVLDGQRRPLFLSISSLGDTATRFAVPIGHGIPYLTHLGNGSWRDYDGQAQPPGVKSQGSFYLSTTAHMEALQSHFVVDMSDANDLSRCTAPPPPYRQFKNTNGKTYGICDRPNRWNTTPYWAMEMPATIVPDHSGIFNSNFVALLEVFFLQPSQMSTAVRPLLTAR